jgi:hypothetical protein
MFHHFHQKMFCIFGWWFLFSILAISLVKPIFAQEVVFEEDFSSGTLDRWEPTRDDGSLWSVVDGAAEAYVRRGSTITELVPKDIYWNTDWKNISYTYDFTPISGSDKNTSFGWEDSWHWFEIHFSGDTMQLVRRQDRYTPVSVYQAFSMQNGVTYAMEIRLEDDQISIFANDELIVTTTYHGYQNIGNGGKIGIKAGTGHVAPTHVRYDNITVTLLDQQNTTDTVLPLPGYKQTDPQWADNEYDHATSWSTNPTMSRWGCLVTSITMVMNYHGMTTFTDGTPITPASLNQWLTAQPDGFVGEGLVMWSAVTRLTRQLSDAFGTPKLEYSRIAGDSLQPSIDAISSQEPTVLQVAGHFIAASGYTADKQDLIIEDPGYNYSHLSNHESGLLSTRLLTPSFTDLSYIYVMHDPTISVSLVDESGNQLTNVESFTEQLSEYEGNQTQQIQVSQIAKPSSGQYYLQVENNQLDQPFDLSIFAYDDEANLVDLSVKNIDVDYPFTLQIDYSKTAAEGTTTIAQIQNAC